MPIIIYPGGRVFTIVDKLIMVWNLDFQVEYDLEGQGQSIPNTIGILTKVFCTSEANFMNDFSTEIQIWSHRIGNEAIAT